MEGAQYLVSVTAVRFPQTGCDANKCRQKCTPPFVLHAAAADRGALRALGAVCPVGSGPCDTCLARAAAVEAVTRCPCSAGTTPCTSGRLPRRPPPPPMTSATTPHLHGHHPLGRVGAQDSDALLGRHADVAEARRDRLHLLAHLGVGLEDKRPHRAIRLLVALAQAGVVGVLQAASPHTTAGEVSAGRQAQAAGCTSLRSRHHHLSSPRLRLPAASSMDSSRSHGRPSNVANTRTRSASESPRTDPLPAGVGGRVLPHPQTHSGAGGGASLSHLPSSPSCQRAQTASQRRPWGSR